MTDLAPGTPMFTVMVRDYKDEIDLDRVSLHGVFVDEDDAHAFARTIGVDTWPDFIEAKVVRLEVASVGAVAQQQRTHWLPTVD